jgi:hypothetical protein
MVSGGISILNANVALTAALGANKIYPVVVPETIQPPYLAVGLLSDASEPLKQRDRTGFPVLYVNIHANDYDEVESLTVLIKNALETASLTSAYAGTTFQSIWCSNAIDRPDLYKPEGNIYARTVQFNTIIKR